MRIFGSLGKQSFRTLGLALCATLGALSASTVHAETACSDVTIPVSMAPILPKLQTIYGRLCIPAGGNAKTLQILVHGSTYDHSYWDFPASNGQYSYVRTMSSAGRATLAIDQLGVGRSSHPLGLLVTQTVNANALHDVVAAVRAGKLGTTFSKIVLVGHSFGSLTAWQEAATFKDVDGVLASGASHSSGSAYSNQVLALTRPAKLDPVTAPKVPLLAVGYISLPGARAKLFYYLPNADKAVVDKDEATRSEFPLGGAAASSSSTASITVPVLIVNGAYDMPFCKQGGAGSTTDCSGDAALRASEAAYFAPAAQLEAVVVPNSGHVLNLHYSAPIFFNSALSWLARYFPQ